MNAVGYFVHRPDEYGNAPHLTSPYGYAIANVYPSRAAARGAHGPLRPDEKVYKVVIDVDEDEYDCCNDDGVYIDSHGRVGHQPWCPNK